MALIQSAWAKGTLMVARPQSAHDVHSQLYIVDVPAAGFAAGDILELAALPAYARFVDARIVPVGDLGNATVDVGLMSGFYGNLTNDDGTARTSGNEVFAGAALTALLPLQKADCLLIASVDYDRSIGVKFSAAVAAGNGKRIGVQIWFKQ